MAKSEIITKLMAEEAIKREFCEDCFSPPRIPGCPCYKVKTAIEAIHKLPDMTEPFTRAIQEGKHGNSLDEHIHQS